MYPYRALDIANFFVHETREKDGEQPTNLWIQKMLYYAQGYSLGQNHRPLFEEAIMAWSLGPVVVEVYYAFKKHGPGEIPIDPEFHRDIIEHDDRELLEKVFRRYGKRPTITLVEMTHSEPPWKATKINKEISTKILQDYFSRVVS